MYIHYAFNDTLCASRWHINLKILFSMHVQCRLILFPYTQQQKNINWSRESKLLFASGEISTCVLGTDSVPVQCVAVVMTHVLFPQALQAAEALVLADSAVTSLPYHLHLNFISEFVAFFSHL